MPETVQPSQAQTTAQQKTTVVNIKQSPCDVYIGRSRRNQPPNIWGNPFRVGDIHNGKKILRGDAIRLFREHLEGRIACGAITLQMLAALSGKRLGCFCKPQPCHGDVIAEYADHHAGRHTGSGTAPADRQQEIGKPVP